MLSKFKISGVSFNTPFCTEILSTSEESSDNDKSVGFSKLDSVIYSC